MPLPEGRKPLSKAWFAKTAFTALPKVTRVEIIDSSGRSYSKCNVTDVEIHFQDDDQTLKVFLKESK